MGVIVSRVLSNFSYPLGDTDSSIEGVSQEHIVEADIKQKDEPIVNHMENIADDFMKHEAFTRSAEKYGLTDDFITDDLPLEVTRFLYFISYLLMNWLNRKLVMIFHRM